MEKEFQQQILDEIGRAYRPPEASWRLEGGEADGSCALEFEALRSALSVLRASYASVGQLPPEPPTVRGRIGTRLIKLVRRMLFWYTPQIVHFQYAALRLLEEQAKMLERAERRIRHLEVAFSDELAHNENQRRACEDLKVAPASLVSNSETFETAGGDTGTAGCES